LLFIIFLVGIFSVINKTRSHKEAKGMMRRLSFAGFPQSNIWGINVSDCKWRKKCVLKPSCQKKNCIMFAQKHKVEEEIDDGPPFHESMKIGCGYIMQYLNKWDMSSCSYCQENHSSSSYNSRRCKR
jgi:hypothetical protein